MEVVIATEKLLLDDLKDIKDNLSKVQNQQDSNRDKKQKVILKKVLRLEEGQEYISVLLLARVNKRPQKPRVQKGKKAATRDILKKHQARENGLLEAAVYTYKRGSLKISLQIKYLVNTKSLN